MAQHRGRAVAVLFGAVVFWSSVPLFLKHFTGTLDAWTVNGVRYGVAAVLLLPACIAARGRRGVSGRPIWRDALVPAAVNTLGQVGWALAPYHIDASFMGFGIRSAFFFTLLGSLWLLPEERGLVRAPTFWAGTAVCVAGLGLLFAGSLRGRVSPLGSAILLGTAMVWGFYSVNVRRFMRGYAAHHSFGVICCYTAVALAVLALLFGRTSDLRAATPGTLALLVLSAICGIASAHVAMYYSLERLGPLLVAGGEFVTPFLTFAGAALLFGERLSPGQWLGGCAVVAGSVVLLRTRRRVP